MKDALSVGIDLGTTHTVVAWADAADPEPRVFPLAQLVTASEVEALPLLPSVLYAPLPDERLTDPWSDAPWSLGAYARERGQRVPGRLVASAKSWLSYAAVDRTAAILPWGLDTGDDAPRLSPVEASERILKHVESAWNQAFPAQPLAEQSIVLTVPASFDEIARELTVTAALRAGLEVRLLEEPQAAFYDFMARAGSSELERLLLSGRERASVLVCDVGGGTTDLTLIEVRRTGAGELEFERVAVGRHLLLGGDNIDLALAQRCEARLLAPPARLETARFNQLVLACRGAKEKLLGRDAPERVRVGVAGSGAALVGGTLSVELARDEVEQLVFEGFLPFVERGSAAQKRRAGLVAFGLPYEQDAAITRHVASFFARHSEHARPDALLLNGGLFRSERAAERLRDVVASWGDGAPALLPEPDPDLAVARGAVAYALALAGKGARIGGGSPHGYYVLVEVEGERRALSIVPRGAREGERYVTRSEGLALRVGQSVRFELFVSDGRVVHAPGTIVPLDEETFTALPPLTSRIEASAGEEREIEVALEGELSAVGTLELACLELHGASGAARRFRLAFELRSGASEPRTERTSTSARPGPSSRPAQAAPATRFEAAAAAIERVFGKSRSDVKARETKDLPRELERILGERKTWNGETNRALFDAIAPQHAARRRSEDHERVFWMLSGYCLRPGFGYPADAARVALLAPLFEAGIVFAQQARGWQQFWIAFRRIAAGLDENAQTEIYAQLAPFLAPAELKLKKPKQLRPLAPEEMLELASWLERVPVELRIELGRWLLERTWTRRDPRLWAALGRIGARVPAYASAHQVIPPTVVERWLDHLLRERWSEVPSAARAAAELARATHDRARDVSDAVRREVVERLEAEHAPAEWLQAVREFVPVEERERADWFGDELPVGLRLREAPSLSPRE